MIIIVFFFFGTLISLLCGLTYYDNHGSIIIYKTIFEENNYASFLKNNIGKFNNELNKIK